MLLPCSLRRLQPLQEGEVLYWTVTAASDPLGKDSKETLPPSNPKTLQVCALSVMTIEGQRLSATRDHQIVFYMYIDLENHVQIRGYWAAYQI